MFSFLIDNLPMILISIQAVLIISLAGRISLLQTRVEFLEKYLVNTETV